MENSSNPLSITNKVISEIADKYKNEIVKGEIVCPSTNALTTAQKTIEINDKRFSELLGIDDEKEVKTVMARISGLASETMVGKVLRGLGQQAARVSALAYYILESRLLKEPKRFTNVELSAISTYASGRAKDLSESPLPEEEPVWQSMSQSKYNKITSDPTKLD